MTTTKNKDFAVFILTHGRPDKQDTIKTLKKVDCLIAELAQKFTMKKIEMR